jgi:CelD/BcsL family acetyltransferase involved in cellulose biosynthesis
LQDGTAVAPILGMTGQSQLKAAVNVPEMRILRNLTEIGEVEALWRNLDETTSASFVWFQSFEWCAKWLKAHADERTTPFVLMVVKNGEALAILPLMCTRNRLGLRKLSILGAPHTQYSNIVTQCGALQENLRKLFVKALKEIGGCDVASFALVPAHSALAQLLPDIGIKAASDNESSQIDLSSFANAKAYEAQLSSKASRNLRRSMKQLSELGHVSMDVLTPACDDFAEVARHSVTMKKAWLLATGRISAGLDHYEHCAFLASLTGNLSDYGKPLAFVLRSGRRILAVEIGFLQASHYYAYMGSFEWSLQKMSPGKLQMHKAICWLIDNGVQTYDLLGNPAEYKQHFQTSSTALLSGSCAYSIRGRFYAWSWLQHGRPALKKLFAQMPMNWRKSLHVMRKLEYNFIA